LLRTNTGKTISAVQAARRYHAHQFIEYLNADEEDNDGNVASQRVDAQITFTIESRVNAVLRCLEDYSGSRKFIILFSSLTFVAVIYFEKYNPLLAQLLSSFIFVRRNKIKSYNILKVSC
jgi:hypothetical protein